MSIKIVEDTKREWIPEQDMSFLSTTRNQPMHRAVNKTIYTLLMNIEGFIIFVLQVLNIVNMDHTIKWRRDNVV